MAHRPFMEHLIQKNAYGLELSLSQQQNDSSYFSNKNNFPLNGISLEIRNFGYDDVLGFAFSLMQYQNFTVFQTQNNLCLDFKMGAGIGFITKKYDKFENPKNNAIGSHFNAKVAFKLELNKFFKSTHFGLGAELSHFSNGAISMPNLGLNGLSVYANFGYNFKPRVKNIEKQKNTKHAFNPKFHILIEGIGSVGSVLPVPLDSKRYPIFASRFSFNKTINRSWQYELAFDAVYNVSNLHKYYDSTFTAKDVPQLGFYAGMAFSYYKAQIVFGLGYYVMDKINPLGRIYNRIGYRYYFNSKWFGLFNIRANFGKADFFEGGIGYKF